MIRYMITIFLSAFLLFQVQPIIARFIVPWFGGTASVWNTCMLFFQIVLLLGYCYSHLLIKYLKPKQQWIVHICVIGVSAFFLPVEPSDFWKPDGDENATFAILVLLALTIGLPFFVLSTTGPLIQAWQSRTHARFPTYMLFALSNTGSLLALLSYPFLVEPYFRLGNQSTFWSMGYILFAGLCSYSGWQVIHRRKPVELESKDIPVAEAVRRNRDQAEAMEKPGFGICLIWILLAAAPSSMLLATTNHMCQEVASVPFLWILPLSLYLITFIVCFAIPYGYIRIIFLPLMLFSIFLASRLMELGVDVPLPLQVLGYSTVLLACCMSCHGELSSIKPHTSHLTLFYLMVSIGGALGGVFVVIVSPLIFVGYYEFHLSLILCGVLSLAVFLISYLYKSIAVTVGPTIDKEKDQDRRGAMRIVHVMILVFSLPIAVPALIVGIFWVLDAYKKEVAVDDVEREKVLYRSRNSYGTLSVTSWYSKDGTEHSRYLYNGRIKHGNQYVNPDHPEWGKEPVSYYGPQSGVGVAIQHLQLLAKSEDQGLKIGVVGLGTGTIAAWGRKGDEIIFYEINPQVEYVADKHFTYLRDCDGETEVILGDARIQLENQYKAGGSQKYDVLAIDAFSSDAIPIHLLTKECFQLYLDHLKAGGVLAIHISNRYLNLEPICYNLATDKGWESMLIENSDDDANMIDGASWVLITKNKNVTQLVNDYDQATDWEVARTYWKPGMEDAIWTDDFASLTKIIDWEKSKEYFGENWKKILQKEKDDEEGEGEDENE